MNARMLLLVAGLGAVLPAAGTADWPQWRGPHRDARVTDFAAPPTWPKALTQKWKVAVGRGDATPALVGDKLYVFSRQGEDEVIRCLDAATGKEVWQDKYETQASTGPSASHPGPRSSPAAAGGKVVTLGVRGILSCLDAATGKVIWRKDTKGWPNFYAASSPIIVDGVCVAQIGGRENGEIVAYDLATGSEKWKWDGGTPGYASPALMTVGGTKLIVAETNRAVAAVTAADGKLAWEAPCQSRYNASSPVVDGQTIIFEGGSPGEKAVKIEKDGDRFVAKDLWTNKDNAVIYNTPVLKKGLLYGLSQGNQFFCIDAETGKTVWTAPGPGGAQMAGGGGGGGKGGGGKGGGGKAGGGRGMMGGTAGYGSIVDAGSVLMALTPGMQLVVFQPGDKEYKQLASYKVADSPTYAYPIVAGNRVYVKDQDSVILWTIE
jgi:outer membrane protein assembly factor BamB